MAGASQTSLLWQKNGGWFKTSKGDANEVECLFEGTDDAEACGRLMKLHNSNMWKHLLDVHGVTKDDVRRRIAEPQAAAAPEPLFKRAAGEFRSSVAAPGLGLKSPNFEHASVAEELGASKCLCRSCPSARICRCWQFVGLRFARKSFRASCIWLCGIWGFPRPMRRLRACGATWAICQTENAIAFLRIT
jgi:hypothetical protein